jgi:hypothetical protein
MRMLDTSSHPKPQAPGNHAPQFGAIVSQPCSCRQARRVPHHSRFLEFVMLYVLFVETVLLALPRKISNRILEILFPAFRHLL